MLPGKMYDVLKWLDIVAIPAITVAYVGLATIWGWPYATEVAKTSAVICTMIGTLLGVSSVQYYKEK